MKGAFCVPPEPLEQPMSHKPHSEDDIFAAKQAAFCPANFMGGRRWRHQQPRLGIVFTDILVTPVTSVFSSTAQ